jgi:hypothetical protein
MKHVITTELYIHAEKDYQGKVSFKAFGTDMSQYGMICVCNFPQNIEFDMPEGFNYTAEEIKALQAQKKSVQAEANQKIVMIEERIQSLLCIEHKEAA